MTKKKAAQRAFPKAINTKYGPGLLLGYDGLGQACCSFLPGDAPGLEAQYFRGGPCFTCFIPVDDIEIEKET